MQYTEKLKVKMINLLPRFMWGHFVNFFVNIFSIFKTDAYELLGPCKYTTLYNQMDTSTVF